MDFSKVKKYRSKFFVGLSVLTLVAGCSSIEKELDSEKHNASTEKSVQKKTIPEKVAEPQKENAAPKTKNVVVELDKPVEEPVEVKQIINKYKGSYGVLEINSVGEWSYVLDEDNKQVLALPEGGVLIDKIDISSKDGTQRAIKIKIDGKNETPVFDGQTEGKVIEDKAIKAKGKISVRDVDTGESRMLAKDQVAGKYGKLNIDDRGNWEYKLDNNRDEVQALYEGESIVDTITVNSADNTPYDITIYVRGVNDIPVVAGVDKREIFEDEDSVNGQLTVTDKDSEESAFQEVIAQKGKYGTFSVDSEGGWRFQLDNHNLEVQGLSAEEELVDAFTVKTIDGTKKKVVVKIKGENDIPKFTGHAYGELVEDKKTKAKGKVNVVDADKNESRFIEVKDVKTKYGLFSISSSGAWEYILNCKNSAIQKLGDDSYTTDEVKVKSLDGTAIKLIFKIWGSNDIPELTGKASGKVTEDVSKIATGKIFITDVDAGESKFIPNRNLQGKYGDISVNTKGEWKYRLDNNNQAVQSLRPDKGLYEVIKLKTADGTVIPVKITIVGINDVPSVTGEKNGQVVDGYSGTTTGNLYVNDVDIEESGFAPGKFNGNYGRVSIDGHGKWVYTLDPRNKTIRSLREGEKITDVVSLHTLDGTPQKVSVTIVGANDKPKISGISSGVVKEDKINTTNGKLIIYDPDKGQSKFKKVVGLSGRYGELDIDETGSWTYRLDNDNKIVQKLPEGKVLKDEVIVETADNTHHAISIMIRGTGDAPVFSGKMFGSVSAGGSNKVGGKLTVTDLDEGESDLFFKKSDSKKTKK